MSLQLNISHIMKYIINTVVNRVNKDWAETSCAETAWAETSWAEMSQKVGRNGNGPKRPDTIRKYHNIIRDNKQDMTS